MKKIIPKMLLILLTTKIYAQHKMKEKVEYYDEYNKEYYTKYRSNEKNELVGVTSNTFIINQDPQNFYIGIYNENKPYKGYFIDEKILNEIPIIRYYEKGILMKEYSYYFLEGEDQYKPPFKYNLETIYENGKIKSGYEYLPEKKENGATTIGICRYDNFKITEFYVDAFAENYFNRFFFKNEQGKLTVRHAINNYLVIEKKEKMLWVDFYESDKKMATSKQIYERIAPETPNSITEYYQENGNIKAFHFKKNNSEQKEEFHSEDDILVKLFSIFPAEYNNDTTHLLIDIVNSYKSDKSKIEDLFPFNSYPFTYNEEQVLSRVFYDNMGKIKEGGFLTKKDNETYQLDFYYKGKITNTKTFKNLKDIKQEVDKLYSKALNP
ncbi:hypothetical protein [Chryseobacterium gambrini]|uniref:hypothetical protein n=1 Tax=Chryseobacterium gambrini TaxID=373672 RepID=UPI0022F3B997|nr:hypothetical protein [Chryseobacterium gambrini]WBX95845.1 hypothetical protein PE065_13280 [Chryseobacterium gambrini]